MADGNRPQRGGAIRRVEPPVLLELPGEEAEHAGNAGRDERHRRQGQALLHARRLDELRGDHRDHRHEQLVRHRDHGKVLDGVELGLDQQRDAKPHAGLDDRPDGPEHRLDGEHQPRLVGPEP